MVHRPAQFMLGFCTAIWTHIWWHSVPQIHWLVLLFISILILRSFSVSRVLIGFLVGLLCFSLVANWYLYWHLGTIEYHQNYLVEGIVDSVQLDNQENKPIQFDLKAKVIGVERFSLLSPKILVHWYQPAFVPKKGNKIKLYVKLSDLSHRANFAQRFKKQVYLTSQSYSRIATVKDSPSNQLLDHKVDVRQQLIEQIFALPLLNKSWLIALATGYRDLLTREDWDLLKQSSTAHLFSISGMHLGLVAVYLMFVCRILIGWVASRNMATQQKIITIRWVMVIIGCYYYMQLVGEQIPVMRAFVALVFFAICICLDRPTTIYSLFLRVVFVLCLFFPFSLLGLSFWLSVGAIFLILCFMMFELKSGPQSKLSAFIQSSKLQWWFFLVGVPITYYLWEQLAIIGFLANLLIIPIVALLLLPLLLISLVFTFLQLDPYNILVICDYLMECCLLILKRMLYAQDWLTSDIQLPFLVAFTTLIALLFWLKSRLVSSAILFFNLIWLYQSQYPVRDAKLTFFDVGHGNAAFFTTGELNFLFDFAKGDQHYSEFSRVVLPYLIANQVTKVDVGLVSHFDSDHSGGLVHAMQTIQIDMLLTPRSLCIQGQRLASDNLSVDILWPRYSSLGDHNKDSCVALLTYNNHKILFTADIGIEEELQILSDFPELTADILVAPHHGSKSSSSAVFIEQIHPDIVIFTTNYPNQWGHPHTDVMQRYKQVNAKTVHLGKTGALEIGGFDNQIKLTRYREDLYNRWYFKKSIQL